MKKKNILFYLLAFLIPILIINIVFIILKVSIFSEKSFMVSDMQAQYYPLFSYYKNVFNGTESLFYTFNSGLGNSMLSTFAYYLASPLNLIILLFDNIHLGIIILMILKIGLSGLTMYIFLDKKINDKKIYTLIFSTCYSLMAYNIGYCFNIMWLDAVILAPLVLLGIDKLIKGKPILFVITLFITILSNYYIGYMVCIFSTIYIIYSLFMEYEFKKDKKIMIKTFLKFVLLGILSVLIASFILIPGLIQLTNSNKGIVNIFKEFIGINQTPLNVFSDTFIGTHNYKNILNESNTLIYMGLIMIPLLYFYLVNKSITKKEKKGFIFIFLIFIISVCFKFPNIIWHGISFPQCFNYRYSFLFCLFFIYIAYKSLIKIDNVKKKYYFIFFTIYIFMAFLTILFGKIKYENYLIYISVGLMILYLFLLYNLKTKNKDIIILIFLLTLGELLFNAFSTYNDYSFSEKFKYIDNREMYDNLMLKYSGNYRMEKIEPLTANDSLLLSYKGVSHFLSTTNGNVITFLKNLGLTGNNINIEYAISNSELINSILGIKYVYSKNELFGKYEKIDESDLKLKTHVYINPSYLSFGYMVSNNVLNYKNNNLNVYEYQNYILNLFSNNDQKYFSEIKLLNDNGYYTEEDVDRIFILTNAKKNKDEIIDVLLNGNIYKEFIFENINLEIPYNKRYRITFNKKPNDLEISDDELKPVSNIKVKAYKFNIDLFNNDINKLKDEQLNITKMNKDYLEGNINVLDDGMFFTTIPYEKGWKIYVDGKLVKYQKLLDTFIGFDLKKGEHNIKFKYETPYFKTGIIVSITSLIGLILCLIMNKKIDNKQIN